MGSGRLPLLDRVLIGSEELSHRVVQLGNPIARDYPDTVPLLVCILKGAYVFLADLTRCVGINHELDFMAVSSYGPGRQSSTDWGAAMRTATSATASATRRA